jgi:DNA-binding XRE family transcriptional regulator
MLLIICLPRMERLMRSEHETQPEDASPSRRDTSIRSERPSDVDASTALALRHRVAFGRNFRRARVEAALTLDDVAAISGLARTCLNAIESGQCDPRLRTMTAIADAVGCELWTLVR